MWCKRPLIFLFTKPFLNRMLVGCPSLKVYSGTIKVVWNWRTRLPAATEKINQLFLVEGNKRTAINELVASDIGATETRTHTNNTLHARGKSYELPSIRFPSPNMTVAIEAIEKGGKKLSGALHQLREGPTLIVEVHRNKTNTDSLPGRYTSCCGKWKIKHNHKLELKFVKPNCLPGKRSVKVAVQLSS